MALIQLRLSETLVEEAKMAGIPIEDVCEEALRDALSPRRVAARQPRRGRVDDATRYQQGLTLGRQWARTIATIEEVAAIASARAERWQDLAVDHPSLLSLLLERGEVSPTGDGRAWLTRTAFSEGLVDAASDILDAAKGP